jgi:hypothetical protein
MARRLLTNIAIAGLITMVLAVAAMWVTALADGHVRLLVREYDVPPEFRGNHGPWRHARVLGVLYNVAVFGTMLGVLPIAWAGALVERTRRAEIVAGLATVMLLVNCAHVPLFD